MLWIVTLCIALCVHSCSWRGVSAQTSVQDGISNYVANDIANTLLGASYMKTNINLIPASISSLNSAAEAVDVATVLGNRVQSYVAALGQLVKVRSFLRFSFSFSFSCCVCFYLLRKPSFLCFYFSKRTHLILFSSFLLFHLTLRFSVSRVVVWRSSFFGSSLSSYLCCSRYCPSN